MIIPHPCHWTNSGFAFPEEMGCTCEEIFEPRQVNKWNREKILDQVEAMKKGYA